MNQMTHSNNNPLDSLKMMAKIAASSGNYKDMSEATMLNLMLTAKDLGISPMKAINGGFHIIKGKVCMSTALMADRIRKEGHSIKVLEWTSKQCVILGIRKDNADSVKLEYTIEDANQAGLTNSETWKRFPKNMLYNRAMATLARTLFPDVIGCAYSEDEGDDIQGTPMEQRKAADPISIDVELMPMSYHHEIEEALGDDEELTAKFLKVTKLSKIVDLDKSRVEGALAWIKKQKGLKMQGEEND